MNPLRVLRGKPVIDVNDVLTIVTGGPTWRVTSGVTGGVGLHCIATDVASAQGVDLHGMRTQEEVWTAILASSRMPWAEGPPVEIDGRRYLDGGLVSPIPVAEAIAAGATHVLALQTRPFGIPRKSASRVGDRLIERHLRGLNPALVAVYRERIGRYELLVDDLARRSGDHAVGPAACARAAASGRHAVCRPARAQPGRAHRGRDRRRAAGRGRRSAAVRPQSRLGSSSWPSLKRPSWSFSGVSGGAPPGPR